MEEKKIFCDFISEYIMFLDELIALQKQQLSAVIKSDLRAVESTALDLQTFLKRLANMEKRRGELQIKAGFADKTFREIIDSVEDKSVYEKLFVDFTRRISDVTFYNNKSQCKVKSDLLLMNDNNDGGMVYTARKTHTPSYVPAFTQNA